MRIGVVVPVHNCAETIGMSLRSVLAQTTLPDEIVVVNDGSSDRTPDIVRSFESRIAIINQEQRGAASARNVGCQQVDCDLVAFLDADDVWHPRYLEIQRGMCETNPKAAAYFTGHVDFRSTVPVWADDNSVNDISRFHTFSPAAFVRQYNKAAGVFASMSYCCVRKDVLNRFGSEPFQANGAEDTYLFHLLALHGDIVLSPACLAGYRISQSSLSSNRLRVVQALVQAFELLEEPYRERGDAQLRTEFKSSFASKRREYGKLLMGAGKVSDGRRQLLEAARENTMPASVAKSLTLLATTWMPAMLQPKWPSAFRTFAE